MNRMVRALPMLALGMALMGSRPLRAAFQAPAVPPAPAPVETAPAAGGDLSEAPEYDANFEPFTDNPVYRIKTPPPMPPPTPLFQPYEPTASMDPHAATSRLARTTLSVVEMPVLDATVGDTVNVPMYLVAGQPITALVLRAFYDGEYIQGLDAVAPAAWKQAAIVYNNKYTGQKPEHIMAVVEYSPNPSPRNSPLFTIHFLATAPGESRLQPEHLDISNEVGDNVPFVFRNGLIRVHPKS